jgi:hypothetical protein
MPTNKVVDGLLWRECSIVFARPNWAMRKRKTARVCDSSQRPYLLAGIASRALASRCVNCSIFTQRRYNSPDCDITSNDAKVSHHPRLLVFDDVAMKHPIAGIVSHENHIGLFVRQQ